MLLCDDGRNQVSTTYWEDEYQFSSIAGKSIGVMGDGDMSRNQNYFTQYGCKLVCVGSPTSISQLHSYGYALGNIIIALADDGWQQAIDAAVSQGVNRFYIDEPIRLNRQWLVNASVPYIASKGGNLTISESYFDDYNWYGPPLSRGRIGSMVDLALSLSPSPFVCCHTHFERGGDHIWHYHE